MSDKFGLGVVGTGAVAEIHANAVNTLEEIEIVAACDLVEARVKDYVDRHDITSAYTDVDQILKDSRVRAVLVCTPPTSHCPIAEQAAAAGVHVMVEKPLTLDLRQADTAIAACRSAGIKFAVIYQRRFYDAAQRAHRAIEEGKIGKVILGDCVVKWWRRKEYYLEEPWRGTWDKEGGAVLVNQAIHAIDIYQWLMGPVESVYGLWDNFRHPYIEAEDVAVAALRFKNGALGIIEAALVTNPTLGARITIHGDNGASVGFVEAPEGSIGVNEPWTIPGEEAEAAKFQAEQSRSKGAWPGYHALQIQEFVQAILEDRDPAVTAEEGRKSVEIVKAIYESARLGAPVKLPLLCAVPEMDEQIATKDRQI